MTSLSRFCLGTCNSYHSVSETKIEVGHISFGEEVIKLLIWACNYSRLTHFSFFFSPNLVIRSNYKPKLPALISTKCYSDMNNNETEAAEVSGKAA